MKPQNTPYSNPNSNHSSNLIHSNYSIKQIQINMINRAEEEKILKLALLCSEHVLLVGRAGTGKSLLADLFFSHLEGKYYKIQLSKFIPEEMLFGAINIKALREEGIIVYNYKGSILDSNYAFLDELFDANDSILRSLLGVLNERVFVRGTFMVRVPLITAVATANYTRYNEVTEAVIDRFLFQWEVQQLSEDDLYQLYDWEPQYPKTKIPLSIIYQEQRQVSKIVIPDKVKTAHVKISVKLGFSTRRFYKSIKVLKAQAYLNDREVVKPEDLMVLKYLYKAEKSAVKEAENVISEYVNVYVKEQEQLEIISELEAVYDEVYSNWNEDNLIDCIKKLKKIKQKLIEMEPVTDKVRDKRNELLSDVKKLHDYLMKKLLEKLGIE